MGFLRLILALSVLIDHLPKATWEGFLPGSVAVEAFFIISGFYMALILSDKYDSRTDYWLFLSNRVLRLLPIYWLIALVVIILSCLSFYFQNNPAKFSIYIEYFNELHSLALIYFIFTNFLVIGQDIIYFIGLNSDGLFSFASDFRQTTPQLHSFLLVPQAWSLSLELMFYIFAPLLSRQPTRILISIILASFSIRLFTYNIGLNFDPWTNRFFPIELGMFLIGMLLYRTRRFFAPSKTASIFLIALLFSYIAAYPLIPIDTTVLRVEAKPWVFYLLFTTCLPVLFQMTKASKVDRWIGELSFPLYISHLAVIAIMRPLGLTNSFFVVSAVLIFSILLVKFVAKPIDSFRASRVKEKSIA